MAREERVITEKSGSLPLLALGHVLSGRDLSVDPDLTCSMIDVNGKGPDEQCDKKC